MHEHENLMSRRAFLRWGLGTAAKVGMSAAASVPLLQMARNELELGHTIPESVLIAAIIKNDCRLTLFGLSPDFSVPQRQAWNDIEQMSEVLGRPVDYIGQFTDAHQLTNPQIFEQIRTRSEEITKHNSTIVLTLGANSPGNGMHPLHPDNFENLSASTKTAAIALNKIKGPIIIRWLIEANNRHSFALGHGRGGGLPDDLQREGFIRSFVMASNTFKEYRDDKTLLAFCPYAEFLSPLGMPANPFVDYLPIQNGKLYADIVGINAFSLYPGSLKFGNELYWTYGHETPEDMFIRSLEVFNKKIDKKVPRVIFEYGDYEHNPKRLKKSLLVCAAYGAQGFMHLNYDKRNVGVSYETRWNMTPEEMAMYGKVNDLIGPNGSAFNGKRL